MSILKIRDENRNIVEIPALKGDTGKSAYQYAQDGGYTGTEEEFSEKLSTEWVNESDLETEVTNQLDSVKADIVQELINQLQGLPVFGTVDEDNTITVTSALADGTYTLMYEYVDGTTSEVGTIIVGNGETVVIVNLLESAVGAQGTVLNEVGYLDGYYISGNAGVSENNSYLGSDPACFATGFMPYTKDQLVACTPIYVKGVAIDKSLSHVRIGYYPSYDYATYIDPIKLSISYFSVTELGTDYYKITPVNTDGILEAMTSLSDIAYFRLSLNGSGSGVIITVNQEITDNTVSAYTNLADTSDEMWAENYRINSSGSTVEVTEDQRGDITMVMTNLIDVSTITDSTKIHMKALDMLSDTIGYNRIYFYDSNKNYLSAFWQPAGDYVSNYLNVSDYDSNVQILTKLVTLISYQGAADVGYIRLGGILTNTSEDVIITIDEEIV